MARTITPTIELGLGGSFTAQALASAAALGAQYKYWAMRVIGTTAVAQNASFSGSAGPPAGWSSGDTLSIVGQPPLNTPSDLPEGGAAIRLNGTSQYLVSVYDERVAPGDIGPQSLEVVLTFHAVPGVGQEPAVLGGSTEFAVTARSDGRLYAYYNGAAVANLPFALNTPTHVVVTRSNTSPTDAVRLYVNGTFAAAAPANGTINRGYVHAGKHWTNAHYLNATYSRAGFYSAALPEPRVQAHRAAMVWTDVTADCRVTTPVVIERGIKDNAPIARVAATGTCSFALDNSEMNSERKRGLYTPGHAECRQGFGMGVPCRVSMNVGVTRYTQFIGRIRRIAPTPGVKGERLTAITATDWMDEAARFKLGGTAILQDVTADEVFAAIVDRMPNQPHGRLLWPCSERYELALDNTRDEDTVAQAEFVRLQSSEVGRAFVSREGSLVCESRYTRPVWHRDVAVDIDTRMLALDAAEITDATINRVIVTVHPRRVDDAATTELFSIDKFIELEVGKPQTITGTYVAITPDLQSAERVGGIDMQAPVYEAWAETDSSGTPCTADVTVVTRFDANTVTFTLTNNRTAPTSTGSPTVFVTKLSVRGRGIYDFKPQIVTAENAEAIAADGVNEVSFDMGYQQHASVGQAIADALLAAYQSEGMRARQVTVCANDSALPADLLARDISDRVALSEAMTALDAEYHINGVRIEYSSGARCDISWWLATPAEGDALVAWQGVPYNPANVSSEIGAWTVESGDQVLYRWKRKGPDSLVVAFLLSGTSVSGSPVELRVAIPGGFVARRNATVGTLRYTDNGSAVTAGFIRTTAERGYLRFIKVADQAWATSTNLTSLAGTTCEFEILT